MGIGSSVEDYKNAMIALSPTGACWPTDNESNWVKLLYGLSEEFARVDTSCVTLLDEEFPNTSTILLENWERVVGLPDAFSNPDASIEERQAAVLFKLQARGGQSKEYLEGLIETLGFENTIVECNPFEADLGEADSFLFDETWLHHFIVFVHASPTVDEKAIFEARFKTVIPAQSVPIFIYE